MKHSAAEPIEPTAVYDSTDTPRSDRLRSIAGRTVAYGLSVADALGRTAREGGSQLLGEARMLRSNPRGRTRAYQDNARWAVDKGREQLKSTLSGSDKAVDWTEEKLTDLLSGAQEQVSGRLEQTFISMQRGVATSAEKTRGFIRRSTAASEERDSAHPHVITTLDERPARDDAAR